MTAAGRRIRRRTVLFLLVTCMMAACAMGDILNGPLPVDVTEEEIVGTWKGQDDGGTFVFAEDGTLTASDHPADALRTAAGA